MEEEPKEPAKEKPDFQKFIQLIIEYPTALYNVKQELAKLETCLEYTPPEILDAKSHEPNLKYIERNYQILSEVLEAVNKFPEESLTEKQKKEITDLGARIKNADYEIRINPLYRKQKAYLEKLADEKQGKSLKR